MQEKHCIVGPRYSRTSYGCRGPILNSFKHTHKVPKFPTIWQPDRAVSKPLQLRPEKPTSESHGSSLLLPGSPKNASLRKPLPLSPSLEPQQHQQKDTPPPVMSRVPNKDSTRGNCSLLCIAAISHGRVGTCRSGT